MGFLSRFIHCRRFFCDKPDAITMKYLNVAEKNDAAKNIAAILSKGSSTRREGLSTYNKIYEFDGVVDGQQSRMVMTSVSGHLLNYAFAQNFKSWTSCNPVALFDAPVSKVCPDDYVRIKRTLEREVRSCQGLIVWTDCDREGENIGFEVVAVCTAVRQNLRVFRAKFSEITRQSVFRALSNLERPDRNVSDAVDVRSELDLRTGAAFTRLQTLRLQKVFPQKLADKLISYGSCQFPTLGFVVERYKAIEDFIAEQFWRIKVNHTVKELTTEFNWKRDRLFDRNACEAILDICKADPLATVESVENKPKSKWRPLPLDTVEMEKNISRKLKITAKDAMKIAEKLYTQGFISYPRTETNMFPKELNLANLVEQQREDNRWGPFAARVLNEGGPNPRHGKKSDQAHPPIHPIKYAPNLTGNEQRVYEYIVRHFLACVSKDALGHETIVNVDIADEKFTAKGLVILERNYLDVYIYEKWNAKEINEYQTGDTFNLTELDIVEGTTSPPKLLTEADLIALMEKHGIGTDATHADHIDTIKSREYVALQENVYFVPGTLGMGLVEGYDSIGLEISLAKPRLRAEFEKDLKLICDGVKDPDVVRREQIEKYKAIFRTVTEKMRCIDDSLANRLDDRPERYDEAFNEVEYKPVLKCPKCGNDMVVRDRRNQAGKYVSCLAYPGCTNVIWFTKNVESIDVLDETCADCGPNVRKVKMKFKHNVFPGYPNPQVLCIGGCDDTVLCTLEINISNVRKQNNNTTTGRQDAQNIGNDRLNQSAHTDLNNRGGRGDNARNRSAPRSNSAGPRTQPPTRRTDNNRTFLNSSFGRSNSFLNPAPGPSTSGHNSMGGSFTANEDGEQEVVCSCNKPAVFLTVAKEGPNKGRKFYKCLLGDNSGGCNFFLWADDNAPSTSNSTMTSQTQGNPNATNLKCNCRLPAVLRTVNKDGRNKGRQFYTCPKPINETCNFFKWADEDNPNGSFNGGGGDDWGGGGGGNGFQGGGKNWKRKNNFKGKTTNKKSKRTAPYQNKPKAKRKCGICGQEGHIRTNCPNT